MNNSYNMKTIPVLRSTMPQVGKIEWIGLRPIKKADLTEVTSAEITVESGLTGDHNARKGGKRMVTLIQREHIDLVASVMNKSVSPLDLRRNIVVSGINLLALHDQEISLGEGVVLKGTGYCVPCSRMEENLGPGGYNTMIGHGGITASVISGGSVAVGDPIAMNKVTS